MEFNALSNIQGEKTPFSDYFDMKKKDYVKPNAQVLSLYTDEFMEGGFHAHSGISGTIESGEDAGDPEESKPTAF